MPLRKNLHLKYPQKRKKTTIPKKRFVFIVGFLIVLGFFGSRFLIKSDSSGTNSVVKEAAEKIEAITAPTKKEPKDNSVLLAELEAYLDNQVGSYGYTVSELEHGRTFGNRDAESYTAASTVKVGIAAYVLKQIELGKTSPDRLLTYTSADYEGGTGSLQGNKIGSRFKVSFLLDRMIKVSDNVATNILIRTYGRSNIQAFLNSNGLAEIVMTKNEVTPRAMAKLLEKIYRAEIISAESREKLVGYMVGSLETGNRISGGVPTSVKVAHKLGTQVAAISDVGIIYLPGNPYILTVYSKGVSGEVTPKAVIKEISAKVYGFEAGNIL